MKNSSHKPTNTPKEQNPTENNTAKNNTAEGKMEETPQEEFVAAVQDDDESTEQEQQEKASTEDPAQDISLDDTQEVVSMWTEKFMRLQADFENVKKRMLKEKIEVKQLVIVDTIKDLLPILDNLERVLEQPSQDDKWQEGVSHIKGIFLHVMEQKGVKLMDVKKGDDFNEDLQEAITHLSVPEKELHGKIAVVIEKGYMLENKVVRYAKVGIGKE